VYLIDRIKRYYQANGIKNLCRQIGVKTWQKICVTFDMIYFADLAGLSSPKCRLKDACSVVQRDSTNPLTEQEIEDLCHYITPKMFKQQVRERFSLDAKMWLLKENHACIGMVWTIVGKTVEPFYYIMGKKDVHFFNNEIFVPYRGQGFNPPLIEYVLYHMKDAGHFRAYIETSQRNAAERRSLSKTSFELTGRAIKLNLGKKNITLWTCRQ
jgi:hypothetical protein